MRIQLSSHQHQRIFYKRTHRLLERETQQHHQRRRILDGDDRSGMSRKLKLKI